MRISAGLSAVAAILWLLGGAQMIVGADTHAQAVTGAAACFFGLALLCLFVFLLSRVARR